MDEEIVPVELVTVLIRAVQDAMFNESTRRAASGEAPLSSKTQQEALALSVLRREFQRVDERRIADGIARLTAADEELVTDRVSGGHGRVGSGGAGVGRRGCRGGGRFTVRPGVRVADRRVDVAGAGAVVA